MKSKKFNPNALIWLFVMMMTTFFFSCEKEKDPLEACRKDPTCEYFVCNVNGERWEPQCNRDPLFGCTPWDVQYYKQTGYLVLISKKNDTESIVIYVRDLFDVNSNYNLFKGNNTTTLFRNTNYCGNYLLDTSLNNYINISELDINNFRIKGKFEFSSQDTCGNLVNLTDGEFNLPYRF
ncbi:MAG: hypothetical protein WAT79_13495 [Saprospiraceae bacterium]